jgi:N-methylhydantoinase A
MRNMLWIGVDTGGTFTDLVVYDDESRRLASGKSPSTPARPAEAVLNAVRALGLDLSRCRRFCHGATVATNTVLERKGARLGVVTTAGFRDVLVVGRGNRLQLYDIKAVRPPGLAKRSAILEVAERVGAGGEVLQPLDEAELAMAAERLQAMQVETVAVCFLHSYANSEPERRAATLLRELLPGRPVTASSEVLPEYREYERFATAALNAYVAPRMAGYLDDLAGRLQAEGLTVAPEVMTSSGGSWPFARMARLPVNSMLSGPAAGVIGAAGVARAMGAGDVITYDMGGTSTDCALISDGSYAMAAAGEIGGLPSRVPQIEINTVGAGGGSIAWLDTGGFLNVGPRSAGADPGPACYGRGGTEPTVTDANVVLGRLRAEAPLGGEIVIDRAAAERAIDALAARLGLDRMATAEGIVRLAVARMTGAIKEISVMRGLDPRDYVLFAFGGAGPLHAAPIAAELGMARVIVPPLPGTFSAYGLLAADRRHDFSRTEILPLAGATLADVEAILRPLREAGAAELAAEGFAPDAIRIEAQIDMRYQGQAFELTTPLSAGAASIDDLIAAFEQLYEQRYAHADSGPVEAVAFRVSAFGRIETPPLEMPEVAGTLGEARSGSRRCRFDGADLETRVYRRELLPAGAAVSGPAVIDESGATTLVPPGFTALRETGGALVLSRETAA